MKIKDKKHLQSVITKLMRNHGPNVSLNHLDVTTVTDMSGLFSDTSFCGEIEQWNVSNVTNMRHMFNNNTSFNQSIDKWDVSNVTDMSAMFCEATSFNQPINNWNVSKVANFGYMFCNSTSFNQPLGNWDVSKATNMEYMFYNATSFSNIDQILNWKVSMSETEDFFQGKTFEQVHLELQRKLLLNTVPSGDTDLTNRRKAL